MLFEVYVLNSGSDFNHSCQTREKVKTVHCNKVAQLKMSTVSAQVPVSLLFLASSLTEFALNKKGWNTYGCRSINSPHNLLISPWFLSQTFPVTLYGNSSIKANAISTYNDLPLPKEYYTRETMILNKFLHSEYARNGFRDLMPLTILETLAQVM